MPIGSKAVYVPAKLPSANFWDVDDDHLVVVKATDPWVDWFQPGDWNKRRNSSRPLGKWQVPSTFVVADATEHYTPNEAAAFLQPDGETIRSLEPTCRPTPNGPIWGWESNKSNLYGDGISGSHFGSGLSVMGGTIRKGEFSTDAPIRHAIKIEVWGKYLYYGSDRTGFRWPADRSDGNASKGYQGANRTLVMGSLLAIRPGVKAEDLGLMTKPGRILFRALQDYGAYLCDDSGWDAANICAESGVREEFRNRFGYSFSSDGGKNAAWVHDLNELLKSLSVVDNNSVEHVGGGGAPRVPLAPPLAPKSEGSAYLKKLAGG